MARLGKRERMDRRNKIKRNLNSPIERTPRSLQSSISVERLMGNAHTMGFRDPQRKLRDGHASSHGAPTANAKMADGRAAYIAKR